MGIGRPGSPSGCVALTLARSQNGDAWLDKSYLSRLLSGERDNPSRDVLILVGNWGLELAVEDVDELLMAADYKALVPPSNLR